jgi:MFS family permease
MIFTSIVKSKNYPWILVGLLSFVAMLNYMDRQMIATMRPSMQIDIAELKQAANFGRLMAVFLWVYGLMSSLSGMIADRFNRKWLIVGSLFVWSGVTLAMGFANDFETLYALRALMGFSEALYIPAGLSLIADHHSEKTRSLAIGLHMTGIYIGQAFGGFGSVVSAAMSWQKTFFIFGGIGILYALILLFFIQEKTDTYGDRLVRKKSESSFLSDIIGLRKLFSNFSFWIIILYFAIPSLPGWAIKNWAPTLFSETLAIDMTKAGPMATISISLSSLLGVVVGGYISDRWVQKNNRGRIFTGAIGLALTIPSLLLLGFGTSLVYYMSAAVLFGFGFGMFDTNNMPIVCQFVDPRQRATAYGFLNTAGICMGAIITDFLGRSTDAGNLGRDFAVLALVVFLVLILQLAFLRPVSKT